MSGAIAARGRAAGAAAVARWRARLLRRLAGVPGVIAEPLDSGIAVRGRRLRARWLADARLRWIGDAR